MEIAATAQVIEETSVFDIPVTAIHPTIEIPETPAVQTPQQTANSLQQIVQTLVAQMQSIQSELNDQFVEREDVVRDLILAVCSGNHLLMTGPPGTGKSELARAFASHIDASKYFEWLLNRTSDPAEILGPFSILAMEQDRFLRKCEGKLPDSHFAFIDEIYKCNEPTLNILLPILNERIFFNDGVPTEVPLISLIAASNEGPEDESLIALHDRLMFRHDVEYVQDPANKAKMAKGAVERRNPALRAQKPHTMVTIEQIKAMHEYIDTIEVPDAVYKAFEKLSRELAKDKIYFSDRRFVSAFKIMQAHAVLDGRDKVNLDDLACLKHILWEKKEQLAKIESHIGKLVNPYGDKIKQVMEKVYEIRTSTLNTQNRSERTGAAIEARVSLEKLGEKLLEIIEDAESNGRDGTEYRKKLTEIENVNNELVRTCLGIALDSKAKPVDEEAMPF